MCTFCYCSLSFCHNIVLWFNSTRYALSKIIMWQKPFDISDKLSWPSFKVDLSSKDYHDINKESPNFFCNESHINILGFAGHLWSMLHSLHFFFNPLKYKTTLISKATQKEAGAEHGLQPWLPSPWPKTECLSRYVPRLSPTFHMSSIFLHFFCSLLFICQNLIKFSF